MPENRVSRRQAIMNTLTSATADLAIMAMPNFMFAFAELPYA
jgi:hypothetical protein